MYVIIIEKKLINKGEIMSDRNTALRAFGLSEKEIDKVNDCIKDLEQWNKDHPDKYIPSGKK